MRFFVALIIVILLLSIPATGFAERELLNSDDAFVTEAVLGTGGGTIAAVWVEETVEEVRLVASWGETSLGEHKARVNLSEIGATQPALAVGSDGRLHVAWVADEAGPQYHIRYSVVGANGEVATVPISRPGNENIPAFPQIALDPVTQSPRIVWQEGTGTYQTIWAAVQTGSGEDIEVAPLTEPERSTNQVYPQVFVDGAGQIIATWYAFNGEGMELRAATRGPAAGSSWQTLSQPGLTRAPADRLPIILRQAEDSLGALYVDSGPAEGDGIWYVDLVPGAASFALSDALAGNALLPGANRVKTEWTLVYWLREVRGIYSIEAIFLDDGILHPIGSDLGPLGSGTVLRPGETVVTGAGAAHHADRLHVIWWSEIVDGGNGELSYEQLDADLPAVEPSYP